MSGSAIIDSSMQSRVADGLRIVRRVLEQNRNPAVAEDVDHEYSDKFLLAEFLTAGACGAFINSMAALGLDSTQLNSLYNESKEKKSRVTLRFQLSSSCEFTKEETREVADPTTNVTTLSGAVNLSIKNKTITKIKEYFWKYNMKYTVSTYFGTDVDSAVVVTSSEKSAELKTSSKDAPHPIASTKDPIDVDLTWFIQQLNEEQQVCFSIDRNSKKCHTPRRNNDIDSSLEFFSAIQQWCTQSDYLIKEVWDRNIPLQTNPTKCEDSMIEPTGILIPVLPLLEKKPDQPLITDSETTTPTSSVLPRTDLQSLLNEQERALAERLKSISTAYPDNGFPNKQDAATLLILKYTSDLCISYARCVDFIERMIYNQLVKALGKVVTAEDFSEYMLYHNRRVFKDEYQPKALSYPVRTGVHTPEGYFGIERVKEDSIDAPITTVVRKIESDTSMRFALSAASNVTFSGDRYVHSFINHRFSSHVNRHNLVASARQFSSYIVLLGRIGGNELFLPSSAFILKDKDTVTIPLLLEEVPSAKQFKSAIQSLSHEQQRFAKAYRSMQLESTLFGLCVIQIKPQLERVLNLNPGTLRKEISLTQDLMELFIKYQVASDLLSYECDMFTDPADVPGSEKIAAVKKRVAEIQEMLKAAKEEEIAEATLEANAADPLASSSTSTGSCSSSEDGCSEVTSDEDECEDDDDDDSFGIQPTFGSAMPTSRSAPMLGKGKGIGKAKPTSGRNVPLKPPRPQLKPTSEQKPVKDAEPNQPSTTPQPAQTSELDVSQIPKILEKRFEEEDTDDALRPTIIKTGDVWSKTSQEGLLKKPVTTTVEGEGQKDHKTKAYDLLDALTRSGALEIPDADLHVIVATTHCFDQTLMDTVVKDNINPIEKMQKSTLIAATTIHGVSNEMLLQ